MEVDVTRPKVESVVVEDPFGHTFEQKVVFDWFPPYCNECKEAGHACGRFTIRQPQRGVRYQAA